MTALRCPHCSAFLPPHGGVCRRCGASYRPPTAGLTGHDRPSWGRVGGAVRAKNLTPERRSEIARLAATARWSRKDDES